MWSLQAIPFLFGAAIALSSAEWRSQSIYQIITDRFARSDGSTTAPCNWGSYCGGSWQGIISRLDYIQGMGFTAVWISPVVKNIGATPYGDPYHGYWGQDLYSLNPAFGTADDLKSLSAALHARGMYLMVDVVANNMAYNGAPNNVNYSTIVPFKSQSQFHPYCAVDWSNTTSVQQCWSGDQIVSLPDLRTEDRAVQSTLNAWIGQLVSNYSIDGLRLDSAMSVNQNFWSSFVTSAGVYAVGEVLDGNPTTMCAWQSYMPGTLNYAAYYWIVRAFQSSSATMSELANNIQWENSTCKDTTLLGNFNENHDNPRFPSFTNDPALVINAIAFAMLNDGIPIIYYGQEQGFNGTTDPYNREPLWPSKYNTGTSQYTYIRSLNAARHLAQTKDIGYASSYSSVVYSDTKTLATLKGSIRGAGLLSVFSDLGATGASTNITIAGGSTGFAANTQFTDLLSCKVFTTDGNGDLVVTISNGLPRTLYRTSALAGSDPCASSNVRPTTSLVQMPSTTSQLASSTASSTTSQLASSTASSTTSQLASSTASSTTSQLASSTASSTTSQLASSTASSTTSKLASSTASSTTSKLASSTSSSTTSKLASSTASSTTSQLASSTASSTTSQLASSTSSSTTSQLASSTASSTTSKLASSTASSSTSKLSSSTASSTTVAASPAASTPTCNIAITFNATVPSWALTIKVVGSISQLGSWNPSQGSTLTSSGSTASGTARSVVVNVPAGTTFQYKYVSVGSDAYVTWEADPNRNYTVAADCSKSTATVSGTWQS